MSPSRVSAATFTPGCNVATLIADVTTAYSNNQADTITLSANCVYHLPSTLTIPADNGNPANTLTINGTTGSIITGQNLHRVFVIDAGAAVTINTTELSYGAGYSNNGGVINNAGTLTLNSVNINNGASIVGGGGVYNSGTLTVNNSQFSSVYSNGSGGMIFNSGTATIANTTFDNVPVNANEGGGIFNSGTLSVTNSTFTRMRATYGAGIMNRGSMTVSGSTFRGIVNGTYGLGISNYGGTGTISGSTFDSNRGFWGGGLDMQGGTLSIVSSVFKNNYAGQLGGGIYVTSGTLYVINSTFAGNRTAIYMTSGAPTVTVTNTTINGTVSGYVNGNGVEVYSGTLNLNNSILAYGTAYDCLRGSATVNAQNSIIEQSTDIPGCINGTNLNNLGVDPQLGAFTGAYYVLGASSPAVNSGNNALAVDSGGSALATDQIGNTRIQFTTVDRGSIERSSLPVVSITPSTISIGEGSSSGITVLRDNAEITAPLTVNLVVAGDANTPTTDYSLTGGSISGQTGSVTVTIPANQSTVTITAEALDDLLAEPNNTLSITLAAGTGYSVESSISSSTITIPQNDFQVSTTADSGEGSLRQAIDNSLALNTDDTITFASSANGTITMLSDFPQLQATGGALTITGNGSANTIISGNNARRVLSLGTNSVVTLNNLRVTAGGGSSTSSGAIWLPGGATLTLNSVVVNNSAGASNAGGIDNLGTLIINSSVIDNNTSTGSTGGIRNSGTLTVNNSVISNNVGVYSGSGISAAIGTTTNIYNSSIVNNRVTTGSGAVWLFGTAVGTIVNSTIAGNTAGGAVDGLVSVGSTITLRNSIVSGTNGSCSNSGTINGEYNVFRSNLSCITGTNTGNIEADPLLGAFTGTHYPLTAGSPAINMGNNALVIGTTDQLGAARIQGGIVDMGAVESNFVPATVTIAAQTATAIEGGANGTFRIARGTDTAGDLIINFTKSGTATDGSDYTLGTSATILNGNTFVDVTLTATDDAAAEADETVILTLASGTGYVVAAAPNDTATVTIARNDVVVTSTSDSGEGSLRQAVENALIFGGSPTVTFSGVPAPIVLSSPVTISGDVTIDGGSAITVDTANDSFRAFTVTGGTVLLCSFIINGGGIEASGGNLTIGNSPVIIIGNNTNVCGGGLLVNGGTVILQAGSQINSNTTTDNGGGICVTSGSLTVTGSGTQVNGNTATLDGGGIYVSGGTVIVESGASVSGNTATNGGGIHQAGGDVSVTDSFIQQNTGGAIAFASSGIRTVTNTCIVLNTDTAVSFTGGSGVIATNNWWGTAAGPFSGLDTPTPPNDDNTSGSYGDSVTPSTDASVFDYSSYQTVAPSGCYACSVPSAMGGIDRAGRICSIVP